MEPVAPQSRAPRTQQDDRPSGSDSEALPRHRQDSQGGQAPLVGNPPKGRSAVNGVGWSRLPRKAGRRERNKMIDRLEAIAKRSRDIDKIHKGGRPPLWGTPQKVAAQSPDLDGYGCPAKPGNAETI